MSVTVEKQEHNLVKITVEIPVSEVEAEMNRVYLKQRGKISIPGFRKGKAPRAMIEKMYGKGVFLEDAIDEMVPAAYADAVAEAEQENGFTVASYPQVSYDKIEVGQPVVFSAVVAIKPEVTLGAYKGLEIEAPSSEVTEEELEAALKEQQEKNATFSPVEDRPVADGDMISLNFEGKVDGEPFEGGSAEGYSLTIGSHSFIPGFEEQLIGMETGETKEVEVTFPEDYHAKELAGKPAVFTCTVNGIKTKELPELDDEFAGEVSDFETLDEYKADLMKQLTEKKQKDADTAKENAVVAQVIENSEMDIPELMIESEARNYMNGFAERLEQQGLSMENYLQYLGMTEEQMMDHQKVSAKKSLENRLVLEAVARAEAIEATEEDVQAEISRMAESYGIEAEKLGGYMDETQKAQMKDDIVVRKALDFLRESAVVK